MQKLRVRLGVEAGVGQGTKLVRLIAIVAAAVAVVVLQAVLVVEVVPALAALAAGVVPPPAALQVEVLAGTVAAVALAVVEVEVVAEEEGITEIENAEGAQTGSGGMLQE